MYIPKCSTESCPKYTYHSSGKCNDCRKTKCLQCKKPYLTYMNRGMVCGQCRKDNVKKSNRNAYCNALV